MVSEPVKHLFHIRDKLQSGPQNNEGFLPAEMSYPTEFDAELIRITLVENGAGEMNLTDDVRKEFYPMAEELKEIVRELADAIDDADHGILAGADKLIGSNDTVRLGKSLDSLVSQGSSDSSSEHISSALECLRLLATQVTSLKVSREKLKGAGESEGSKFNDALNQHKKILSSPYGASGQILTGYLDKVTHYYEDHKHQLDVLKETYQTELNGNRGLIKDHGLKDWLDWSYDYLRQNRDKAYCATCTKYARKDVGGPGVILGRLRDDGLESYVEDVQRAQVVDGHAQYPDGILSDDKYRDFINNAFKRTLNDPKHLSCGIKIMRYATKQESVRKAMQEEADHEYWRGPRLAAFGKLHNCQQHSYAAAADLIEAITKVIHLVFNNSDYLIRRMTCYLEDTYCNIVAEDFNSARQDYDNFLTYYSKLQKWRQSYDSLFS
ncbi:hypothetical protein F53441_4787 [Fusarium austroafricanum]|uniref:Uncharacterized protein n=1 Tax=Fusarium austroafricanum TaxID=2364996 RepID=A0A8H4KJC8_9HYPO|nr:hypothetical protein F53441_4787 [Fusarium austroafricanum]